MKLFSLMNTFIKNVFYRLNIFFFLYHKLLTDACRATGQITDILMCDNRLVKNNGRENFHARLILYR